MLDRSVPGSPPPFTCDRHRDSEHVTSVVVTGDLDPVTAPRLQAVLGDARASARLILLDLAGVRGAHPTIVPLLTQEAERSIDGRGWLLVVAASPSVVACFAAAGAGAEVDFLFAYPWPRHEPQEPVGAATRLQPLANAVNAGVEAARVLDMPEPGFWVHDSVGVLHRAWAPEDDWPALPAGTPVEIYLDRRGRLNGWRDPGTGLAVNQRRIDELDPPRAGTDVACRGGCGVVWRAAEPTELLEHGEHCLTCDGPLFAV
jgi:hypothetical protein